MVFCNLFDILGFQKIPCDLTEGPCLFDITKDPCEFENLLGIEGRAIPTKILDILDMLQNTIQFSIVKKKDLRGHPSRWNNTWTNFLDYEEPKSKEAIIADSEERFKIPDIIEMDVQNTFL